MSETVVNPRKALFSSLYVDAMFVDGTPCTPNAMEVAIDAGYSRKNAQAQGNALLADPLVQQAIETRLRLHVAKSGIDLQKIIDHWADVATADPGKIMSVRKLCCRYCHGEGHAYQWGAREFAQHAMEVMTMAPNDPPPSCIGGLDWRHNRPPHPDCPECQGEGVLDHFYADTRNLSGKERKLFAGIKLTKYGPEIQLHNQSEAWTNLARTMGAFIERREHSGPNGGPIKTANVNITLPANPQDAAKVYAMLIEGKS